MCFNYVIHYIMHFNTSTLNLQCNKRTISLLTCSSESSLFWFITRMFFRELFLPQFQTFVFNLSLFLSSFKLQKESVKISYVQSYVIFLYIGNSINSVMPYRHFLNWYRRSCRDVSVCKNKFVIFHVFAFLN